MQEFGVERLPWGLGCDLSSVPFCGGVYFVYAPCYNNRILYVGASKNINLRWRQHHWRTQFLRVAGIRVAWISVDDPEVRKALEATLIQRLGPPLNAPDHMGDTRRRAAWFRKFEKDEAAIKDTEVKRFKKIKRANGRPKS